MRRKGEDWGGIAPAQNLEALSDAVLEAIQQRSFAVLEPGRIRSKVTRKAKHLVRAGDLLVT
jgi:hypothetical protein